MAISTHHWDFQRASQRALGPLFNRDLNASSFHLPFRGHFRCSVPILSDDTTRHDQSFNGNSLHQCPRISSPSSITRQDLPSARHNVNPSERQHLPQPRLNEFLELRRQRNPRSQNQRLVVDSVLHHSRFKNRRYLHRRREAKARPTSCQ